MSLSLRRHFKSGGKSHGKERLLKSLEATSENRHRGCGRDMLGQTSKYRQQQQRRSDHNNENGYSNFPSTVNLMQQRPYANAIDEINELINEIRKDLIEAGFRITLAGGQDIICTDRIRGGGILSLFLLF